MFFLFGLETVQTYGIQYSYSLPQRGTNNTGELMGIGQALIWLRDIDKSERPAIMLYDSGYAANMVTGRWQPNTNTNVVQ